MKLWLFMFCSILVHRANEWLGRHGAVHVVSVEVIEVSGVYGAGSSCVETVKNVSQASLPAYLKILRYCGNHSFLGMINILTMSNLYSCINICSLGK